MEPDALDWTTQKKDVFGLDVYEPTLESLQETPRQQVEPEADDDVVIKNDVFGENE